MADRVRLQIKTVTDPETWVDVGKGFIGENIPVEIEEKPPTDSTKTNPSTVLSYDVNGDLQYIDETIGTITYRTTLGYTSRVLTSISSAVEL